MDVVELRRQRPLHHRGRSRDAWLALGLAALVSAPAVAQRPAPPKGWTIDTTGGVPVALRRGGMLSTDTKAELLGPVLRDGPALLGWLGTFARSNAATLGTVDPATKDEVSVSTIAGQRVAVAAQAVRTAAGTRYLAYGMLQDTPAGAPVLVVRSTFGDMLTLARVFRSSVEALLPYILSPTDSMRALRPVALAAQPVTSFRGLAGAALPPADTTTSTVAVMAPPASGDSAATTAIGAGLDDAIAALEAPAPAPARGSGASAAPVRAAGSDGLAASLTRVVFYQFGDLQYHPVALFRDGTSYDIDSAPLETTDAAASRAAHANRWGRWRTAGRTHYLSERAGGQERDYVLGGGGFHTAFAAPPGSTLDGTYKAVSGSTMGETSTLLTTELRFSPDGRFAGARDFASVGNGQTSGVTTAGGARSSSAGRYRVAGHRLVLTYGNGVVKEYFFAFGSGGDPEGIDRDMLFIGSTAYVR